MALLGASEPLRLSAILRQPTGLTHSRPLTWRRTARPRVGAVQAPASRCPAWHPWLTRSRSTRGTILRATTVRVLRCPTMTLAARAPPFITSTSESAAVCHSQASGRSRVLPSNREPVFCSSRFFRKRAPSLYSRSKKAEGGVPKCALSFVGHFTGGPGTRRFRLAPLMGSN